jgi:hypothetical protein
VVVGEASHLFNHAQCHRQTLSSYYGNRSRFHHL